jgi:hypothetical protein
VGVAGTGVGVGDITGVGVGTRYCVGVAVGVAEGVAVGGCIGVVRTSIVKVGIGVRVGTVTLDRCVKTTVANEAKMM